ncbi:competence type IV pilus major pilin ComGC [Alkalihalobacillus pseudalcaliphilus]|uniref:competence type IV pilus major pilin ComGC n=1 Tax=Alkalihalobacillus pseudalcaliphilus TaxID=79884 RepID=UPI00064DC7F0|nr:competence type IV pilus major pilin ComGC [Alkalihalobacillus pseudalcaliphilus]KMK76961.1 hypothetical protein AB990_05210 [Alkalihalobacillus pseudalcaliphilus]
MKRKWQYQRGFTLIEMLVVLMIISVLLLILIPNLTKNQSVAQDASCETTIRVLQSLVYTYQIDNDYELPEQIDELGDYIVGDEQSLNCPNGAELEINEGIISVRNQ